MTLKALVRERLESGQEMPSDLFNVFAGKQNKNNKEQINMNQVAEKKTAPVFQPMCLKKMQQKVWVK